MHESEFLSKLPTVVLIQQFPYGSITSSLRINYGSITDQLRINYGSITDQLQLDYSFLTKLTILTDQLRVPYGSITAELSHQRKPFYRLFSLQLAAFFGFVSVAYANLRGSTAQTQKLLGRIKTHL
jgi:hypothetical protein